MEEIQTMNKSSRLSDKQQLFKIKSKTSNRQSHLTPIGFDHPQLPNFNSQTTNEVKPVYEKQFIADAKGKLKSLCRFSYKEKLS